MRPPVMTTLPSSVYTVFDSHLSQAALFCITTSGDIKGDVRLLRSLSGL